MDTLNRTLATKLACGVLTLTAAATLLLAGFSLGCGSDPSPDKVAASDRALAVGAKDAEARVSEFSMNSGPRIDGCQ